MKPTTPLAALAVFGAGCLTGAVAVRSWAQAAPRMTASVLLDTVTEELRWKRTSVRLHLDTWEPRSETGAHQHPGPALLYVLEGQLEERSEAGTRTLRAGQAVWNRGKLEHNVRNPTGQAARALAIHLEPAR